MSKTTAPTDTDTTIAPPAGRRVAAKVTDAQIITAAVGGGKATAEQIAEQLGMGRSTAGKRLAALVKGGQLVRVSDGKGPDHFEPGLGAMPEPEASGPAPEKAKPQPAAKATKATGQAPARHASFDPDGLTEFTCQGACGQTKPLTSFPTTTKGGRGTECRKCRDARRLAAKAA